MSMIASAGPVTGSTACGLYAHQVRHEHLAGSARLQVERDEGRLRSRFVDRHEIPGSHPAEQPGQVVVGNLEVFCHVHTPSLGPVAKVMPGRGAPDRAIQRPAW